LVIILSDSIFFSTSAADYNLNRHPDLLLQHSSVDRPHNPTYYRHTPPINHQLIPAMPPKVTDGEAAGFQFLFAVLKHNKSTIEPAWDDVARECGISYGRNASVTLPELLIVF